MELVVTGGLLVNLAAKVAVEIAELVQVASEGRVLRLVAGVMAMKDGDASGFDEEGEKVDEVETDGAEVKDDEIDFVDDSVAGLIMSDLVIEGESLEGELVLAAGLEVECSMGLLLAALSRPDEDLAVSGRDGSP